MSTSGPSSGDSTPLGPGNPGGGDPALPPNFPKFDAAAAHHVRPKLRAVRAFPAQTESGQQAVGLADRTQVSDRIVMQTPAVMHILPLMNGERDIDEIVSAVGRGLTRRIVEMLVAQLDDAGLLCGPRFDAMLAKMRSEFDAARNLPPATTANLAEAIAQAELGEGATEEEKVAIAPRKLIEALDAWIAKALESAADPTFETLPQALVVPHIDYPRGWINYGSAWGRTRVADRPERVVILGTNHFGQGTGVVGCNKGFETPLGVCEVDQALISGLERRLGAEDARRLFAERFDHEREHSIELQIPWIQHCLGKDASGAYCRVFGALVHDPTVNNGDSYDNQGLGLQPFLAALQATIAELPGKTLIVASADLSHVGPAFGDPAPLAGDGSEPTNARNKVFQHDREMIELLRQRKTDELIAAMAWQQNPTRWCSIGALTATFGLVEPSDVRILNYSAAMDQQGLGMVSSVAMALV